MKRVIFDPKIAPPVKDWFNFECCLFSSTTKHFRPVTTALEESFMTVQKNRSESFSYERIIYNLKVLSLLPSDTLGQT